MDLKEEIILLLKRAKETDEYFNPHFVCAITTALHDVYGVEDELIDEWLLDMRDR